MALIHGSGKACAVLEVPSEFLPGSWRQLFEECMFEIES